jgi:hypothetical protein
MSVNIDNIGPWFSFVPEIGTEWPGPINKNFSDLRNFQEKSENFKPTLFVIKVKKLSSLCFVLASLLKVKKCSLRLFHMNPGGNIG